MWYPPKVTVPPTDEPVTLVEAKAECGVTGTARDDELTLKIAAARAFVEQHCTIFLMTQTVAVTCDCFDDLGHVAVAPLQSVTSIKYFDLDGLEQTVADTVYEERLDALSPSIVAKPGQRWPSKQAGTRITLTAVAGYGDASEVPPNIKQAVLLHVLSAANVAARNALVRQEEVAGIGNVQYGGVVEVSGVVIQAVERLLEGYRRWPLT
ncbi:MAG: hypothetical protein J0H17_18730 [Rhizobiales bacterium]|nr:hypothetical protein [Hyphomicrobiales bacterium]